MLNLLRQFRKNVDASIFMLFGFSTLAMTFAAGLAVDYGRLLHVKSRMAAAADAAALAAGRAILDGRLSAAEVKQLAERIFLANIEANSASVGEIIAPPMVDVDKNTGLASLSVQATVPMTLMRLAGYQDMDVRIEAATRFDQRDVELALALDLTGSMGWGSKLQDLKSATTMLIDTLLPDGGTPNKVRIALAPYSSGVNAGIYAAAATGRDGNGCTFEREGSNPLGDQAPGPGDYLRSPGHGGVPSWATCPLSAPVVPLSDDKAALESRVQNYGTGGATAGHLGMQWARYLVSPAWAGVFGGDPPAPYNDDRTVKAIVLMTDGLFNTVGGRNYGDNSAQAEQSRAWTVEMCTEARSKSIMVFTVGFALEDIANLSNRDAVMQMLGDCAGVPDRFFTAADGGQLSQTFAMIAHQLNNLRLVN